MRIETVYKLKQPLSHIGESESTTSFLNTVNIVNHGVLTEVFALTGNAIRGVLRDCAARYLLNKLQVKIPKKEFNILFSGGNISGSLTTDIDQAKQYRRLLPVISIFGAGVGNQILNGKITQSFALPLCSETNDIINAIPGMDLSLFDISWKCQTGSINFTRFNDSKNTNLQMYLYEYGEKEEGKKKKKDEDSASTQMRYEVEYFAPGAQLYHIFILNTDDIIEIGCFYSALAEFSKNPYLGGMAGKGFGLTDATYYIGNEPVIEIKDCELIFNLPKHGKYLKCYDEYIIAKTDEIIGFLNGVKYEKNN